MNLGWQSFKLKLKIQGHSRFIGLIATLLLCIWGFVGFWSYWEHASLLKANNTVMIQLTAAVQAQTKGLFKQAESMLIVANHWISEHPGKNPGSDPDFVRQIGRLRLASGGLLDLWTVNQKGDLRTVPDHAKAVLSNVSDRDYFRAQFDPKTHGFYIGAPVLGRITQKWVIPISVPVERASNTDFVLVVTIELDRISGAFEAERIKPAGTIGIVRTDGTVIFRIPMDEKVLGKSIAKRPAWRNYISVFSHGSYESYGSLGSYGSYESEASIFDNLSRLVVFGHVDDYPLVAYVSTRKNDVLAPWLNRTYALAVVATLVSLFSLVMSSALMRALTWSRASEAIIRSTDVAVVGQSLDGIITSWNPGAERMFGFSASEIIGQPITQLLPADKRGEESVILEKLRRGEGVGHFETLRTCKDGRTITVSVTTSPIRDSFGVLVGASNIARNITEQKATTRRLQLLASVFTNTSEGILILDRYGRIVEANAAFTQIAGYSKDEVAGNDPSMFRSSRQSPEVFKSLRTSLVRRGEWKGELWSRRKDGEAYSAWLTVTKVQGSSGKVTNYVALFSDITVLRLQQEALEHGAHFDSLTDLPNRLLLSDRLHQAMTQCQRHHHPLAVLYLDLDGFKTINDQFGHEIGDELLITVAKRMRSALRDVDTLARIGGDEFVVLLTNVETIQNCVLMVNRILEACAEPVTVKGHDLKMTASIGVTLYPQDDSPADLLMRHADQAMYEAKQSGKNRFHMFDSAQDEELKSQSAQQDLIQQGLNRNEFVLFYQPKVNMRTGEVVGVEALIRWLHPDKGLLAPSAFLPAIERHLLSETIGTWVIDTALSQMRLWNSQGLVLPTSVNIGARQLQRPAFAQQLADQLARYPEVEAKWLELEILETSALNDIASTSKILQECNRLGVRFAIDDFGTGYSSLMYLRHLRVETLKIDRSFVRDMLKDQNDLSIVKGVMGLAAAFQCEVIAEGVESVAHGKKLIELGCALAQGYAIAKPMPADQVLAWCERWVPPQEWSLYTGS